MKNEVTIKNNREFKRIYARGKSFVTPAIVIYINKNYKGIKRYGIIVSKKVGIAVKRNRSRRIIKEAYRKTAHRIKPGYDIVLIARVKTTLIKSTDIEKILEKQLEKAGVLK